MVRPNCAQFNRWTRSREWGCRIACGLLFSAIVLVAVPPSAHAQPAPPAEPAETPPLAAVVRADLRTHNAVVQAGQPVRVVFSLVNLTNEKLTLRVPEVSVDAPLEEAMGLPPGHVFSGPKFSALTVMDKTGREVDVHVALRPRGVVPAIQLAPYGSVGIQLDARVYYESLARPGKYELLWRPYNGLIESEPLEITVLAEQQAIILTDFGKMTIRFYYDEAPNHVKNFLELARDRFYDNLTFHRVVPGGLIQGGCSRGDGRGIRPDGKRLKAEFSDIPVDFGSVVMARAPGDPNSASSQFYISLGRHPSLDGKQTVFGYLVGDESFETATKIAAVPTDKSDRPKRPVYIRAITLQRVPDRTSRFADEPRPDSSFERREDTPRRYSAPQHDDLRPVAPEKRPGDRPMHPGFGKPYRLSTPSDEQEAAEERNGQSRRGMPREDRVIEESGHVGSEDGKSNRFTRITVSTRPADDSDG